MWQVVDDFTDHADLVRQSAIDAGFFTWTPNKGLVGSSVYEGMGFWGHHALLLRELSDVTFSTIIPNAMFFRYTIPGMEKAYIHSDRESGAHTCIVYLSEHEESYGTAFFKHKPTGLTHMPSIEEMHGTPLFNQLQKDMVSRDPDKWEQIGFVEGKYNRALIFEAPLFHSRYPVEGIGSGPENGRLIWATHFFKMNKDGYLL